jgi:hypothetical protein
LEARELPSRKHERGKARKERHGNLLPSTPYSLFPVPSFVFSYFRAFVIAFGSLSAAPCWAHGDEELGHHWYVPAYRIEMQAQILMMVGVALAVLATSWIAGAVKKRRSR